MLAKRVLWLVALILGATFCLFELRGLGQDLRQIREHTETINQLSRLEHVIELILLRPGNEHMERYKNQQESLSRIKPEIPQNILRNVTGNTMELREQWQLVRNLHQNLERVTLVKLWGRAEARLFFFGLAATGFTITGLFWKFWASKPEPGELSTQEEMTETMPRSIPLSFTEMAMRAVRRENGQPSSARGYTERVLQSLSNLLVLASPEGRIQMVNNAVCKTLGYERNELLGETFGRLLADNQPPVPGLGRDLETIYLTSRGLEIPVLVSCSAVLDEEGKVDGWVIVAQNIGDRVRAEEELRENESRLRELMDRLVTAQEDERQKVARDLHDGMLQMVIAGELQLTAFKRKHCQDISEENMQGLLNGVERLSDAVKEGRRLINNLRPPTLDKFGLVQSLKQELEKLGRELQCETEFQDNTGHAKLTRVVETTVFRICQEAFSNLRKHAKPTKVVMTLSSLASELVFTLGNDGPGFELTKISKGVGLDSMRERAELLDGRFEMKSDVKMGTWVEAVLPLESGSCLKPQFRV